MGKDVVAISFRLSPIFASLFFDIIKDAAQTTEPIMDLEPSHGIAWQRLGIYRNLDEFRGSKAHREGIKRALPR
jgi:hypothetical protein